LKDAPKTLRLDPVKFDNVHQLGGIRTGTLDCPGALGSAGARVALIDTGSGLRFTVALDRGGDLYDASYNQFGLAYLTPNGLLPPNPAYHQGSEWLHGWAGGLLTTCGPEFIGRSRMEEGRKTSLHGRFSNTPACVETLRNPDPARGIHSLELGLIIRDTRMFGPNFEIRRTLRCTLGKPEIHIDDEVTNRGDSPSPHHWLYHCNLGYPLLDQGARFIYAGRAQFWSSPPLAGEDILQPLSSEAMNRLKTVPAALPEHVGERERGLIVDTEADSEGVCHVAIVNERLPLGLALAYPKNAFPRLAHWQHYSPGGCYASALEPFYGSLLGTDRDTYATASPVLAPGESRHYRISFRVLSATAELAELIANDRPVVSETEMNSI